ncbi:alpha/beta hydrolase [Marinilabilia salmonicolor]|uniref:alpha/beta hydrolase n=1 Tax=Marinilabilia salmonicolor TaxID=989 RepID=UPI00029A0E3D|nr:alpha/beta hydrolase [Marinilabilia salmonicolor]
MNHSGRIGFLLLLASLLAPVKAQDIIELNTGTILDVEHDVTYSKNQHGLITEVISPSMEMYFPTTNNDDLCPAVIICPGGGYSVIVYEGEGISTAKEMAENGIAAFVLKYRLPGSSADDRKNLPLKDAQQAIKIVRENASKWNINPEKIGVMGFSAGGHLASTLATHYRPIIDNPENTSLRPDFQVLVYPVISMQDSLTHQGSRNQLLGDTPTTEDIRNFSSELQVDSNTPPAYITHATDDVVVDVDNTIFYFEQLRHHKVPVEMHIYQKGNHGFIFKHKTWTVPLFEWMENSGFLTN